jgi:histidinol dehydrogenase
MKLIRTKGQGAREAAEILATLEDRGGAALDAVLPAVQRIVASVRKQGERALLRYAAQFDGLTDAANLRITSGEMTAAWEAITPAMRSALTIAANQIRAFAVEQLPASWSKEPIPGLTTGQLVRPLASVGCYVPSGRHPLPSTLLMTAIPAQVAGVERIVVVSPKPALETLAAAHHLSPGRRARRGRVGLWNPIPPACRQDRWPRQSLRHRREAPRGL